MASENDYLVKDFRGVQPAVHEVPPSVVEDLTKNTVREYISFIQERLVCDSVEKARKISEEAGVTNGKIGEKPFFVSDEDINISGAIGNSFAVVKPGKPENPMRIIIAHSDVPSLRVPVNPVYTAPDSRRELQTATVSIMTEPFGGVRPEDWYGSEVEIVGKVYMKGLEKRVCLPGRIKAKSFHVDHPLIAKSYAGLKVSTEFSTAAEMYKALGIDSADDFSRSKLYCLPRKTVQNGTMLGYELGAFGQDDRCCVWAALKAELETLVDNDNTTMVFALDNEEIGSIGNSANYHGFVANVIRETLNVVHGRERSREIVLPDSLNRGLLGNMPAIFADVGVGIGLEELEDPYEFTNLRGASKTGWGVMINSDMTTSPKHVDEFISLLHKKLPGNNPRTRYQIGGDYSPVDLRAWTVSAQMHDSFGNVMPCMNVGIPVCGLHHPRTEVINIFDLQWMKEAYKIYLAN